jgi:hypothetical protein
MANFLLALESRNYGAKSSDLICCEIKFHNTRCSVEEDAEQLEIITFKICHDFLFLDGMIDFSPAPLLIGRVSV